MNPIRVAHVITRLCEGGAQENTFQTVRLADRNRFEVDLISGPVPPHEESMETRVRASGVNLIHHAGLVRDVAPWNDWTALRGLERLFRSRRYDIVHTHTSKAGILGRLAAKRARVPIVVHTPHGNVFNGYFSPWKTRLFVEAERRAARWTDRIVALTRTGVEDHLRLAIGRPEQFVTIFSGVDFGPYPGAIRRRERTREELGVSPDHLLIGGVGRLEPVKGFAYFIAAAERAGIAVPHARFVLVGSGSKEAELRDQARRLGDRFRFLGYRQDISELMAALDVLVVPSLNEGMGRVIVEAGAAKTPVVATRVGGIPDIVIDGNTGVLVSPGDTTSMAEALIALLRDRERLRTMGDAARAYVLPRFGLDRMVMRIEALYEELIREKRLQDCG